ncbi:MAG: hypothetical protein QOJ09_1169 [Actinomycetota bacterium]|nr:hypothetical protein [Actinomycetota bacterium]
MILATAAGVATKGANSWVPMLALIGVFVAIVAGLTIRGRSDAKSLWARLLLRPADSLERLTGIPGWAAVTIGIGLYGLLVAGAGFYSDVAWHIALGRDKVLFTAPHTEIVLGLVLLFVAAAAGVAVASLTGADTKLRWRGLRVPWSTIPLGLLGASAVMGFPLDDLWHARYGIDVTMWSPTHMLMILGASLSGLASWLVLAEAGVSPRRSNWARGVHVVAAWLTLQGLVAAQGEFSFGVPQFQQLYLPVLICLAAGFALVASRLVLGPWWTLGIAAVNFVLGATHLLNMGGGDGLVQTRPGGIYVVSALVVEAVALMWGTTHRLRFALLSGLGVGTIGLAGEWLWNQDAYQPWRASLLPDAVILGVLVALGAAVLGAAFGSAVAREPRHGIPRSALVLAGIAVLVALAWPFPRGTGDVSADVAVRRVGGGNAVVTVRLDPPGAAKDARWFQASAWQGGSLVLAEMHEIAPGTYRTEKPVPVTGRFKTLLRLHRGSEMMAVPVRLPADPEIGKAEIPPVDRHARFVNERKYLLREAHGGAAWFAVVIDGLLVLVAIAWVTAFVMASQRVRPGAARREPNTSQDGAASAVVGAGAGDIEDGIEAAALRQVH